MDSKNPRLQILVYRYSHSSKLQMPISSLVEEYKVAKTHLLLTLRDSTDEKISGAGSMVRTGKKWSVSQAVEQAESSLQHQDIVGTTNRGREGLGTSKVGKVLAAPGTTNSWQALIFRSEDPWCCHKSERQKSRHGHQRQSS